jgi:hypothetical protein
MNLNSRLLIGLTLAGALLSGLSQYHPAWATRLGLDWWSLPELQERLRQGKEESVRLRRRSEEVFRRLVAKEEVAREVRAGRLSLREAAARFAALDGSAGEGPPPFACWPYCSAEDERLCRQVIAWVRTDPTGRRASPAETVARRLEEQLRGWLGGESSPRRSPAGRG